MEIIRKATPTDTVPRWEVVQEDCVHAEDSQALASSGQVTVTLERWRAEADALKARGQVGLRVLGEVDPGDYADVLPHVDLVCIQFPKFADGRGYSAARLLRERYGFTGTLRALGDVLRDQLNYMARCGFDSFVMAPGKDPRASLSAFEDFSESYQPAADEVLPLWRRASLPGFSLSDFSKVDGNREGAA